MTRLKTLIVGIILAVVLFLLALLLPLSGDGEKGQYVVINIADLEFRQPFQEITQIAVVNDSSGIGIGIGGIFSYLNMARGECEAHLREFLSLSKEFEIPIVVQLDGEQWWQARPDLWNWWDPQQPGYNPANRENVEWSGWGPEHALKIAWRNWGRQVRVLPPPNFMSPRYREACRAEMRSLIPIILDWWEGLPGSKKHLLIGIKLGWESGIGVNSFYYPDGNSLLEKPESDDPHKEVEADAVPDRGFATIGYAAVTTALLADSGALQESQVAEVVRRHLNDLCSLAAKLGVPREKLFTHAGGWKDEELLYEAALNEYSCPGWSFYRHALDPAKDKGVDGAVRRSDAPSWAAVEWMLNATATVDEWDQAVRRTLAIPKCRYMCLYNWDGIRRNQDALDAIQRAVNRRAP